MLRRPPRFPRTATPFPYTPRCRSVLRDAAASLQPGAAVFGALSRSPPEALPLPPERRDSEPDRPAERLPSRFSLPMGGAGLRGGLSSAGDIRARPDGSLSPGAREGDVG